MTYAYIGLGSNCGKHRSRRHLRAAAQQLRDIPASRLSAISPLYTSAPLGCPGRQPPYYNAVAELQTTLPPRRLFNRLRHIEHSIQKKKRAKNTARRMDIDYLSHGSARLQHKTLTLPHPRLYRRAFVLHPLQDILTAAAGSRPLNRPRIKHALHQCRHQQLQQLQSPCLSS